MCGPAAAFTQHTRLKTQGPSPRPQVHSYSALHTLAHYTTDAHAQSQTLSLRSHTVTQHTTQCIFAYNAPAQVACTSYKSQHGGPRPTVSAVSGHWLTPAHGTMRASRHVDSTSHRAKPQPAKPGPSGTAAARGGRRVRRAAGGAQGQSHSSHWSQCRPKSSIASWATLGLSH